MLDALLYAVRDAIRNSGLKYAADSCEIMDDGQPPPRCGREFVAVHGGDVRTGETDNCLNEFFGFVLTYTMRIVVPMDRVGDQQIAVKPRKIGLNRRCEELRALLHMNWGVIQDANNFLVQAKPDTQGVIYGFCEPARYRGMSKPRLVGGGWFASDPEQQQFGVVADLNFGDARRFQPIAEYV